MTVAHIASAGRLVMMVTLKVLSLCDWLTWSMVVQESGRLPLTTSCTCTGDVSCITTSTLSTGACPVSMPPGAPDPPGVTAGGVPLDWLPLSLLPMQAARRAESSASIARHGQYVLNEFNASLSFPFYHQR